MIERSRPIEVEQVDEVDRVRHSNGMAVEHHGIIPVLSHSAKRRGLECLHVHLDADVFKLLRDYHCAVGVCACDAHVRRELSDPHLFKQPLCLGEGFFSRGRVISIVAHYIANVRVCRAKETDLYEVRRQLRNWRGQRRLNWRAMHCQVERPTSANVIEGRLFAVHCDVHYAWAECRHEIDLVAKRLLYAPALREMHRRRKINSVGRDRRRLRIPVRELNCCNEVEVRVRIAVRRVAEIVRVRLGQHEAVTLSVLDAERTRSNQAVGRVYAAIKFQDMLGQHNMPPVSQVEQEVGARLLEVHLESRVVNLFRAGDVLEAAHARLRDALRRVPPAMERELDVFDGKRIAVVPHHAFIEVHRDLVNGGSELPAFSEVGQHIDAVARVELQDAAVVAIEVLGEVPYARLRHIPLGWKCARTYGPDEMAATPDAIRARHCGRRCGAPSGRLCRLRYWLRRRRDCLGLERRLCGRGGCRRSGCLGLRCRLCRCGCCRRGGWGRLLWRRCCWRGR